MGFGFFVFLFFFSFFLEYNWVYIIEIGRNIVFILKIHQSTEAELQANIRCGTHLRRWCLQKHRKQTHTLVKKQTKTKVRIFKNSGLKVYCNTYNIPKQGKMLLLMHIHISSPAEHADAMFCISEAVEPATVLNFCIPEI